MKAVEESIPLTTALAVHGGPGETKKNEAIISLKYGRPFSSISSPQEKKKKEEGEEVHQASGNWGAKLAEKCRKTETRKP